MVDREHVARQFANRVLGIDPVIVRQALVDQDVAARLVPDGERRRQGVDHRPQELLALLALGDVEGDGDDAAHAAFIVLERHLGGDQVAVHTPRIDVVLLVIGKRLAAGDHRAIQPPRLRTVSAAQKLAGGLADRLVHGAAVEFGLIAVDEHITRVAVLGADHCGHGVDHGVQHFAVSPQGLFGPLALGDFVRDRQHKLKPSGRVVDRLPGGKPIFLSAAIVIFVLTVDDGSPCLYHLPEFPLFLLIG